MSNTEVAERPVKQKAGFWTRRRTWVASLLAGSAVVLGISVGTAQAIPSDYAQTITMAADGSQNGLLIVGPTEGLVNEFEVQDGFDQPIFAIGNDGGPKVFGDDFGVYAGGDVFIPSVYITPDQIVTGSSCPKDNALVLSGYNGSIHRCNATSNLWQRLL